MELVTLLAAAEEAEHHGSQVLFYVLGGAAAVWAVILAALGLSKPDFPRGRGGERLVIVLSVLFFAGAVGSAVVSG